MGSADHFDVKDSSTWDASLAAVFGDDENTKYDYLPRNQNIKNWIPLLKQFYGRCITLWIPLLKRIYDDEEVIMFLQTLKNSQELNGNNIDCWIALLRKTCDDGEVLSFLQNLFSKAEQQTDSFISARNKLDTFMLSILGNDKKTWNILPYYYDDDHHENNDDHHDVDSDSR